MSFDVVVGCNCEYLVFDLVVGTLFFGAECRVDKESAIPRLRLRSTTVVSELRDSQLHETRKKNTTTNRIIKN